MYRFLNDRQLARESLQSTDSIELYMALWCTGFYNTDELEGKVPHLIVNGKATKYKRFSTT